jgi:hypothetical protein
MLPVHLPDVTLLQTGLGPLGLDLLIEAHQVLLKVEGDAVVRLPAFQVRI